MERERRERERESEREERDEWLCYNDREKYNDSQWEWYHVPGWGEISRSKVGVKILLPSRGVNIV